jgi:hypothetical protein
MNYCLEMISCSFENNCISFKKTDSYLEGHIPTHGCHFANISQVPEHGIVPANNQQIICQ